MARLWLIVGKKQSANKLFTLISFIGWFLRNAAASFLSSLQSHKMVLSLGSHCFIHLLQTFFLHSLPLFFPCLLTTFLFLLRCFQTCTDKGPKCKAAAGIRAQTSCLSWQKKNDGRGEKIWFRPNLATCYGSLLVKYCAPRADLASSSFPLFHLHHSLKCFCKCVCGQCFVCKHMKLSHVQFQRC